MNFQMDFGGSPTHPLYMGRGTLLLSYLEMIFIERLWIKLDALFVLLNEGRKGYISRLEGNNYFIRN